MYLIKEEKRTLLQFLALYLGSSFILFAVIAYLFYQSTSKEFYEKTRNIMQINASYLSSKIIHAHMSGKFFSLDNVVNNYEGKIGFYDENNQAIISSITMPLTLERGFMCTKKK